MPYDVTTITVQPNTHGQALPHVERWLKANPRKGDFLACLATDIGDLNTIMLLHHYTSEADMIADRDLQIKRDLNSTPWLTDIIWTAAQKAGQGAFRPERTQIEDDHLPFVAAGVPSVDIIDLEYPAWHTPDDTLDAVSARSMQVVGDVLLAALPAIEARLVR